MSEGALDPRHVEDELARSLRELLAKAGADAGFALLGAGDGARHLVRSPVGLESTTLLEIGELALAAGSCDSPQGLAAVVTTPGAPSSALGAILARAGFSAWALVPLEVGGVAAGTAHLLARSSGLALGADALREGAKTLGPLAFALRGLEAARAAEERGEVVAEVAQGLLHQLELARLFPELIRLVARLCPCDAAAVAVYRPETDCFEHVAVYGPSLPDEIRPGVVIPAAETPIKDAYVTGEVVSDPDGRTSHYVRARRVAEAGIVASLYLPIGNRRGVFCVGHRLPHAFGQAEVALYRSLVPFLEIALRNAELLDRMRSAYRELEAAQERLVRTERLRALGELAAGVAHDLGNVLAIVASHAELLGQRVDDAETQRLVAACNEAVQDGARAVRRVLDMAQGSAPQGGDSPRFLLERVVREVVLLTGPRWKEPGFELDISRVHPVPEAAGDAGEVREAVLNLVLNALDAIPRGGKVALATRVEEERVVFSIEDSGPGIPAGSREKVFVPFYTTKGPGHAGLGLAVVARLARQQGGSVRALGAALGGARFELVIPISAVGSGPHELPHVEAAPEPRRSIEVLLVEDEPSLRNALSALLTLRGHLVVTAEDVKTGLEALKRRPSIQVVVTDLGLPGRSGWELVDEVHARLPALPIVVLSGLGALTEPGVARERGVAAILSKPTTEKDLAAVIESVVP